MPRFTAVGDAIYTGIGNVVSGQRLAALIEHHDAVDDLRRPVCGVGVIFEIADPFLQHVLDAALVTEISQQRVCVNDLLRRAMVVCRPLRVDASFRSGIGNGGVPSPNCRVRCIQLVGPHRRNGSRYCIDGHHSPLLAAA